MNSIVVIPIEVYAREIEHKLLLAYYLASCRGYTVLLATDTLANDVAKNMGQHAIYVGKNLFLQPEALPPGTILSPKVDNTDLKQLLSRSVKIVFVDEEGGLFLDGSSSDHDCQSFLARLPLNPDEYHQQLPNLAFCHWGPYQTDIASHYCPNILNLSVGPPCLDAARAFSQVSLGDSDSSYLFSRASVLSSTTPLTASAFQKYGTYLAIDCFFEHYDVNYATQAILAEVGAASLAHKLSKLGFCVEYRAHPASGGLVLNQWYKHCRSHRINISYPHRDPILSYLMRSDFSLHTAGCTTSLLSYYLKKYSLRFGAAQCGIANNLIYEPHIDSLESLQTFIESPELPRLLPLASKLIERPTCDSLVSFENISNVIDLFAKENTSSIDVDTFLFQLKFFSFRFVTSRNLRHLRWWKMPKFSRFYSSDISQCFRVAQATWPSASPARIVARSSQYLVIKA
jgi:hypothetical protein